VIRDPKRAVDAARSPTADPETLAELAPSEHVFVRVAVALNARTGVRTLAALVPESLDSDDALEVAIALLQNCRTPRSVLVKLGLLALAIAPERYTSRDFFAIRFLDALASHRDASEIIPEGLLDPAQSPTHVRDRISRHTTNANVLRRLINDPSIKIRSRALRQLAIP
jgi:hypothetical protein